MLFIELQMLKESMKEGLWVTFSLALVPQMTHISSILSILIGQPCEMPHKIDVSEVLSLPTFSYHECWCNVIVTLQMLE
jgi:hypothetical protein